MVESQKRRVVFMGTPNFAGRILRSLIEASEYEVVAVYTRPDKKSGRGLKTIYSEVKKIALENGLPLFQPASLKSPETVEQLRLLAPDYLVVAAYGLILPQAVLDIPSVAPINVHASLLPYLRGAAPVQRAIMENPEEEAKTGVSIMKICAELDAGPVYAQKEVPINHMDYISLETALADAGATLLIKVLQDIDHGGLRPVPQDATKATYAHKLEKADGLIDWKKTADEVDALVRAVTPWPGAHCKFELSSGSNIQLTILKGYAGKECAEKPGTIFRHKNGISVACCDKWYELENVCPQGRKAMSAADFANGQIKVSQGICGMASPLHVKSFS